MSTLLLSHITLAILTFFTGISVWNLPNSKVKIWFRGFSLLSISTGILLSLDGPLTLRVCARFGIYLFLIILTEYRMNQATPNNSVRDGI